MKKTLHFLSILLVIIAGSSFKYSSNESSKDDIYVIVKYKAQPDKAALAIEKMKELLAEVEKEPHYSNVSMLVDPTDSTNILLFEQWNDESYYKGDHMKTTHLQQFINDSRNFLAGPPDISFWKNVKK